MGAAELMLRLGCSLVAWLVLLAHCLWLAALDVVECGDAGARPWFAMLLWTPMTLAFAVLLRVGFVVPGVGGALRLPAVLVIPLAVLASRAALTTLADVNLRGGSICDSAASWTPFWAPAQLATLVTIGAVAIGAWRRGAA
jgi:hypothetical protein